MSALKVTKTRIHAGIWEGVVHTGDGGEEKPAIAVTHLEQPVLSVDLTPSGDDPQQWFLRIAIPPDALSDGIQTFVISDAGSGERLADFTIVTGEPLEDDIRAEIELLRAELDMLKRAFRRHCLETM